MADIHAYWGGIRYGYGDRPWDYLPGGHAQWNDMRQAHAAIAAGQRTVEDKIKEQVRGVVQDLVQEIHNIDYNDVFDQLERYYEVVHTDYFQYEADPNGAPWAPLSPSYIEMKGHDTVLFRTGRLQESLTSPHSEYGIRGERHRTASTQSMRWGTRRVSDAQDDPRAVGDRVNSRPGFPIAAFHQGETVLSYLGPALRPRRRRRPNTAWQNWATVDLRPKVRRQRVASRPLSFAEKQVRAQKQKEAYIQRFGKAWAKKLARAYRIGRRPRPMVGLTTEAVDQTVHAVSDHVINVLRKQS